MPWNARTFAQRHNQSLHGKAAAEAAKVATAMVKAGVPEGEAIATGNKIGDKRRSLHTHPTSPKDG